MSRVNVTFDCFFSQYCTVLFAPAMEFVRDSARGTIPRKPELCRLTSVMLQQEGKASGAQLLELYRALLPTALQSSLMAVARSTMATKGTKSKRGGAMPVVSMIFLTPADFTRALEVLADFAMSVDSSAEGETAACTSQLGNLPALALGTLVYTESAPGHSIVDAAHTACYSVSAPTAEEVDAKTRCTGFQVCNYCGDQPRMLKLCTGCWDAAYCSAACAAAGRGTHRRQCKAQAALQSAVRAHFHYDASRV